MFFDECYIKKNYCAHYVSLQLRWPNRPLFLWSLRNGTLVGFEVWMHESSSSSSRWGEQRKLTQTRCAFMSFLLTLFSGGTKLSGTLLLVKCSTIRQPKLSNSKLLITRGCYDKLKSPPSLQDFIRNWIQVLSVMVAGWFRLLFRCDLII